MKLKYKKKPLQDPKSNKINFKLNKTNRSSVIFPIFLSKKSSCKIIFLSYWIKKHGNNVVIKLTARNLIGDILENKIIPIHTLKAFEINAEIFDYFSKNRVGFSGTIEVEVFSKNKPFFNFPAISIIYEDKKCFSSVHACTRFYNTNEKPKDYAIPFGQTGFDIKFGQNFKNYIIFVGANKSEYKLNLILEINKRKYEKKILFHSVNGQMHIIYIEDYFYFKFSKQNIKVTIEHDLDSFPRFYVGTIEKDRIPTLTHTFFDTSKKYLNEKLIDINHVYSSKSNSEKYYNSAFMVPVLPINKYNTIIKSYGQNLDFNGTISIKILNKNGKLIKELVLKNKKQKKWLSLNSFNFSNIVKKYSLSKFSMHYVHLGFSDHNNQFPNRFKLGLNFTKNKNNLGTNICFSPKVLNDNNISKPFVRRWFPLGGKKNIIATIHVTSFTKSKSITPKLLIMEFVNYYGKKLIKKIEALDNSTVILNILKDDDLKKFFRDKIGWCFVTCNNFVLDGYFFSNKGDQLGGDHVF